MSTGHERAIYLFPRTDPTKTITKTFAQCPSIPVPILYLSLAFNLILIQTNPTPPSDTYLARTAIFCT